MKKKYYFSQKKRGSELLAKQDLMSMRGICLPVFPFEFSVEMASNRMIENKIGLIKVLKHSQLAFFILIFHLQKYEKI